MLQKENLEQSQKEAAVAIVQKIQGTELFSLLENYMGDASRKIAELLNRQLIAFFNLLYRVLSKYGVLKMMKLTRASSNQILEDLRKVQF